MESLVSDCSLGMRPDSRYYCVLSGYKLQYAPIPVVEMCVDFFWVWEINRAVK